MTSIKRHMLRVVASGTCVLLWAQAAPAITTIFFNPSQTATVVSSNITAVTLSSGGYLFTYSQDGYFTGGLGGGPIGRFFTVVWPDGVQAQAYTDGPPSLVGTGANITLKRADGNLFELQSFTGKILLNTAGAGGAFEVTPQLNGNDALGSPFYYDCTGYAGMSFPCPTALTGYDTYQIHMWGDFALTQLTLVDASVLVQPTLQISLTSSNYVRLSWPINATGFALQQNFDSTSTNWTAVTNLVDASGTNYQVIIFAGSRQRLFRLWHP